MERSTTTRGDFHPDATFETADGTLDRSAWKEIARGLVERGAVISGFELRTADGETAAYRLTLAVGDDAPLELAATGRFVDGLVIHVAPADPASYSELVARSGWTPQRSSTGTRISPDAHLHCLRTVGPS